MGGVVEVKAANLTSVEAPYDLVKTMRASVLVLGPLVAREGRRAGVPARRLRHRRPAHQPAPRRPSRRWGRRSRSSTATWRRGPTGCAGAEIYFDTVTVTGTENILMAAALAEGETVIRNAACEPEVVDLAELLVNMGAKIQGAGGPVIRIQGVDRLHGADHTVIPDRIETGTFIAACAIAGGDIEIRACEPRHLRAVVEKFREAGVRIEEGPENLRVRAPRVLKAANVSTLPYPGFPTDMQAQYMALMTQADGHEHHHRDHLREPLHARGRAAAHGRPRSGSRAAPPSSPGPPPFRGPR